MIRSGAIFPFLIVSDLHVNGEKISGPRKERRGCVRQARPRPSVTPRARRDSCSFSFSPFMVSGAENNTVTSQEDFTFVLVWDLKPFFHGVFKIQPNTFLFPIDCRVFEGRNYWLVIFISLTVFIKSLVTSNWCFVIHPTNLYSLSTINSVRSWDLALRD